MRPWTFIALSLSLFAPLAGPAQQAFSGIFQQTDAAYVRLYEISWDELRSKNEQLGAEGYELVEVEAVVRPSGPSFWAIWREGGRPARLERAGGWENVVKLKQRMAQEGFVPRLLDGYREADGREVYFGIWAPGRTDSKIWKLDSWAAVAKQSEVLARDYYQLVDLAAVPAEWGGISFLTTYQKLPPPERAYPVMTDNPEDFYKEKVMRNKSGYALVDYETYEVDGQVFLAGLYKKAPHEENCRHRLDWNSFADYQQFLGESYRLVSLEISEGDGQVLAPPFRRDRLEQTPNVSQEVVASMIRAGQAADQSAPCAAANALTWLAERGFPKLAGADGAASLARLLANADYMHSLRPAGAPLPSVAGGLVRFVEGKGYTIGELAIQHVRSLDGAALPTPANPESFRLEDGIERPSLAFAQEGLVGNGVVLLQWGVYEPTPGDSLNRYFQRVETRWATLVGYGINEYGNKNPDILIVHSPSHGGEAPLYLRLKTLDSHLRLPADAQLLDDDTSRTAGAQYFLEDALPNPGKRFAIWEGALVLKLDDEQPVADRGGK